MFLLTIPPVYAIVIRWCTRPYRLFLFLHRENTSPVSMQEKRTMNMMREVLHAG